MEHSKTLSLVVRVAMFAFGIDYGVVCQYYLCWGSGFEFVLICILFSISGFFTSLRLNIGVITQFWVCTTSGIISC